MNIRDTPLGISTILSHKNFKQNPTVGEDKDTIRKRIAHLVINNPSILFEDVASVCQKAHLPYRTHAGYVRALLSEFFRSVELHHGFPSGEWTITKCEIAFPSKPHTSPATAPHRSSST
jgi:hypothetical protein